MVVTIHRQSGMRVVIFLDDHEPAHVHVFGDGHAKINLLGPSGRPRFVWAEAMRRNDLRRALTIVSENQTRFLAKWEEIHG